MLCEDVVHRLLIEISEAVHAREAIESFLLRDRNQAGVLLAGLVCEDHEAVLRRDPAYGGEAELPLVPHAPFRAVLAHRLAHRLWGAPGGEGRRLAVAVQHLARVMTGIDIHPAARIGRRFIVDHGSGTVVGETAVVGDDCYLLNGVTLGARGIAANAAGQRHPRLGDRVEVGAFARILGPIIVGDDVFVAPLSCVTEDVPDGARVASTVGRARIKPRRAAPLAPLQAGPLQAGAAIGFAGRPA